MKTAPLLKVSVAISAEAEEAVSEAMAECLGQLPSVYYDVETGEVTASVYLPKPADWTPARRAQLQAAVRRIHECGLEIGPAGIAVTKVRHQDWAESWKRHFKPFVVGRRLLVKPSWSRRRPGKGQQVLVLDPGLSFGTGQHPTTRFCLEQLASVWKPGKSQSVLDIGTGSGILAIAAVKLGFGPVEAIDFDADAVRIARDNARVNGVGRRLRITHEDLTRLPLKPAHRYDVVCANLIYDLLLAERRRILHRLEPGGTLILAGILHSQFDEVRHSYETAGLQLLARRRESEWESGAFSR